LDQGRLAAHQKKAHRLRASLVFIDESALLMSPLVRRTWSPCGRGSILRQRTRHHQKLSVIAALVVNRSRHRVRLCFRLHLDQAVDSQKAAAFLRQLGGQVLGPIMVVWDRLNAHRSKVIRAFAARRPRFRFEFLPPYAPELNPVEYAWSWLKTNPLANYAPQDATDLARAARSHGRRLQNKRSLLWSFIDHSPLPLRHK
jgi:transposase